MKKLFLFVTAIIIIIAFTSCTKDSISPSATAAASKSTSTTGTGSEGTTATTTAPAVPTIDDINLQGKWTVVSDSSFWAGELPKRCVSAYAGKSGDSFNFSKDGKLYIQEDALADTPAYSVDTSYRITVTYADCAHFDEAPGFGFGMSIIGSNPTVPVSFTQKSIDANTLILNYSIGTPGGAAFRVVYLKR